MRFGTNNAFGLHVASPKFFHSRHKPNRSVDAKPAEEKDKYAKKLINIAGVLPDGGKFDGGKEKTPNMFEEIAT